MMLIEYKEQPYYNGYDRKTKMKRGIYERNSWNQYYKEYVL